MFFTGVLVRLLAVASLLRRVTPSNVIVCESAASDRAGNAMLKIPVARGQKIFGLASLEPVADFVETESQNVELTRLDDAIQDDVGFIKIDVEGHELAVLKGSTSLIRRCKPILLIECEERHNPGGTRRLFEFLKTFGYAGKFVSNGPFYDISEFDAIRDQTRGSAHRTFTISFFPPKKGSLLK